MRPNRSAFCTLNRIIQRVNASSSSINVSTTAAQNTQINTEDANFQAEMKTCIFKASDIIQQALNNTFVPYRYTHTLRYREYQAAMDYDDLLDAVVLALPDRLLSPTTFIFNGTTLNSNQFYTRPEGVYPAEELAIYGDVGLTFPSSSADSISLLALWGYHPEPSAMWRSSGDTAEEAVDTTETDITVNDADNFETLQYIRIESEYCLITALNSTTNVLTVERGVRGTAAANHAQETAIDVFVPIEDVADETARLAVRRYLLKSGMEFVPAGEGFLREIKMGDVQLADAYYYHAMGAV